MSSPLEQFKSWYKSLPKSHQIDIAAIAGIFCSEFKRVDYRTEPENMPTLFLAVVGESESDHKKNAGMSITLRAFIDFFIYRERSNPAGWKENEVMMKGLAKEHDSETFQRMGNEMEFRAKQWVSTCDKWKQLCSETLSDTEIDHYIKSNSFGS